MPIAYPDLPDTRDILENMRDSSDTDSYDILYCALVEPSRVVFFSPVVFASSVTRLCQQ